MKYGIMIWMYQHRLPAENVNFFAAHGFDAISTSAFHLDGKHMMTDQEASAMAEALQAHSLSFNIHHCLPYEAYSRQDFQRDIDTYYGWMARYGLTIHNLSFDVPLSRRPHIKEDLEYLLERFEGTSTRISVEDFAIREEEYDAIRTLRHSLRFGQLIDLGHMNIRLHRTAEGPAPWLTPCHEAAPFLPGDNRPDAFAQSYRRLRFPVYEIHVSNNDGEVDGHFPPRQGTADMAGVITALCREGFDGIFTIETVPAWHGWDAKRADEEAIQALSLLRKASQGG